VGGTMTLLALFPIVLILRARFVTTDNTRIHVVQDMDFQWKAKAQTASEIFPDGRSMRLPVEGTVAVGGIKDANLTDYRNSPAGAVFTDPTTGENFRTDMPVALDAELLELGKEKYATYCAPCHGVSGHGDGTVAVRALSVAKGWVPVDLHNERSLGLTTGQLYSAIVNGVNNGNMQSYTSQLPDEHERWAVVAYIRALQRSQNATTSDLPEGVTPQEAK